MANENSTTQVDETNDKKAGIVKNLSVTPMLLNVTGLIEKRDVKITKGFASNKNGEFTDSIKNSWLALSIHPFAISYFDTSSEVMKSALLPLLTEEIKADTVEKLKGSKTDLTFEGIRYVTETGQVMFYATEDETAKFAGLKGIQSLFAEIRQLINDGYSDTQLSEFCHNSYLESQKKAMDAQLKKAQQK